MTGTKGTGDETAGTMDPKAAVTSSGTLGDTLGRAPDEAPALRPSLRGEAPGARLRLIATTDLHARLLPHDYYANRPSATGLALAARLIRSLRAEAEASGAAVLLLDNGDLIQGSLLSDWVVEAGDAAPFHPMIEAMNRLGFDAATLGNHEFNYGLPFLRRVLAQVAFPVVLANVVVDGPDGPAPLAAPSLILERAVAPGSPSLRVGLLGLTPPQITTWDRRILAGQVHARDLVEAAREQVGLLREDGADLVVALCHSGLGPEEHQTLMENAAVPVAAIPGIDAVIAGHSHEVFPGPDRLPSAVVDPVRGRVHGVPLVQPGAYGSHVGVIDLALERRGGRWAVEGATARTLQVTPRGTPPEALTARADPLLMAIAAPIHARLQAAADEPVGQAEVALHTYLAMVAGSPALDVVADAQRIHAGRVLRGTAAEDLPILAAVAPFRAGGRGGPANYVDVAPGAIVRRDVAGLYVFPNGVAIVEITGAGLRDWLERGASAFRTVRPGVDDQPLLDPAFPSYNFETVDGLEWTVDPTRPPRTDAEGRVVDAHALRVGDLRHEGRPVADSDLFALATNSYRLSSGGGFAAAVGARRLMESPRQVRDVVLAHVRAAPVAPAPRPRWRFVSLPGTAAWFDTGPGVLPHLGSTEGRVIEDMGPAPDGFRRLRLRF